MKKITLVITLLSIIQINAQHQTIGLGYSFGFSPTNDKFTFNNKEIGNYSLGWYQIPGSAEANLSGYGGINFFTQTALRLTIARSGNVGIGIYNPSAKLHVNGSAIIDNTSSLHSSLRFGRDRNDQIIADNSVNKIYGGGYFLRVHNETLAHKYIDVMMLSDQGDVGIGITKPSARLHVSGSAIIDNPQSLHSSIRFGHGLNDRIIADNSVNKIYGGGYFFRVHNETIGHKYVDVMMLSDTGKVGIGTRNPDSKLTVKGKIHAEEVKIDLSVPAPDYVFKKDYDLLTIAQVQQHIKEKGHLPNIPSAKVLETEGVDLGIMNMKLLEKIEELTLYTIDQEKRLQQQTTINKKLQSKNNELEARLVTIEKLLIKE
ncbi:hypothetical protein AWE51_21095 [Aquimarina aggregata]|uniref:Peptidase S74 domain-containing protein n=1 Tax=Aquimarina aggregata TaxID=1642818 RepID=A0A163BL83_9FLAO|nr:tail fiber protein [Aquimarina aggregata]KZS41507.1 hypothetical protein AWE51_21095 [Aquimarina aggregata]